jgi:hypothetical protein
MESCEAMLHGAELKSHVFSELAKGQDLQGSVGDLQIALHTSLAHKKNANVERKAAIRNRQALAQEALVSEP